MITKETHKILSAPFPKEKLSVKVQSVIKEKKRAMLVLYLQHTDVMDRLDEAAPSGWSTTVLWEGFREIPDFYGGVEKIYYVNMRMTIGEASRENVGEGRDPKTAYSDAVKRCAVLFGVGRFLYASEQVWVDYDPVEDKQRTWTLEEFF